MKAPNKLSAVTATLSLILAVSFSSCKKGDTGPEGPQGVAGTNGTNGVSNIQTGAVSTTSATWVFDSGDPSYGAILNYSAITQAVFDRGTVQVFIGFGNGSEWGALPYSEGKEQFLFSYQKGHIFVEKEMSDGSVPTNPGNQTFKIVVIPPASKAPNSPGEQSSEAVSQVFTVGG